MSQPQIQTQINDKTVVSNISAMYKMFAGPWITGILARTYQEFFTVNMQQMEASSNKNNLSVKGNTG